MAVTRRRTVTFTALLVGGLVVALALAFFVSPSASSAPDGLEKVAGDRGFLNTEKDSAVAGGPTADYAVKGVDDERLSTGLAGVIGVTITFAVAGGLFLVVRRLRRTASRDESHAPASG